MKKSQLLLAVGGAMGIATCAMAQNTEYHLLANGASPEAPGDLVGGPIDLDGQTGENGNLGIQYLDGFYSTTARGITTATPSGRLNQLYRFDSAGVLLSQVDQIAGAVDDAWGYRDGASDGTSLYFGWGGGIAKHDADGSNGTLLFDGTNAPGGTYRALAYDSDLNGGSGGFWSQSFASDLVAVDMSGNVLTTFANNTSSLYGLALADGRLFGHSTGGDILEIDRTDGSLVGVVFNVSGSFTSFSSQGGLSEVPGGGFGSGNAWDLAALGQGAPDEFAVFELVPAPGSIALLGMGGLLIARRRR